MSKKTDSKALMIYHVRYQLKDYYKAPRGKPREIN